MKKILFLVIDGLPDDKIPKLGNKTPLEAAKRNNLDRFAKNGFCGYFKPLFLGKFPWSEEAHFSIFGYDPKKCVPGRGMLEAMGTGIKISKNDVALRANLGAIDSQGKIIDRRANRIDSESAKILAQSLDGIVIGKTKFLVKPIYGHRLAIILRGGNLSEKISDSDPKETGKKIRKIAPLSKDQASKNTADILNQFLAKANFILKNHSLNKQRTKQGKLAANCLLTRSAGKLKKVVSFEKKWGLKSACLSLGALYRGIGKYLGMDLLPESGGRGRGLAVSATSPNYIKNKFLAAKKALEKYDFVFCHIKGADLLAENGDYLGKKNFIETIDKELAILDNLKNTLLVITSDHGTSCLKKRHTASFVPLLIFSPKGEKSPTGLDIFPLIGGKSPAKLDIYSQEIKKTAKDKVHVFTEKECQKGKKIESLKILPLILRSAGR